MLKSLPTNLKAFLFMNVKKQIQTYSIGTIAPNYLALGFDHLKSQSEIESIINSLGYFESLDENQFFANSNYTWLVVKFKNAFEPKEMESIMESVKSDNRISFVNKIFKAGEGESNLMFVADQIQLKVKENIEQEQFDQFTSQLSDVSIKKASQKLENFYLISNKNPQKCSAQLANTIQNNKIVEMAEPLYHYTQLEDFYL